MKLTLEQWKEQFNQTLHAKLENLPEAKPFLEKYKRAWVELQKSLREVAEGTDLQLEKDEALLWSTTRQGKTGYEKISYIKLRFAGQSFGIYPFGISQDVDTIKEFPGIVGSAHLSMSADVEFLGREMLYLFERSENKLIWLYPKVSGSEWYEKGEYGIVDIEIIQSLLEANFLK